ncbi:hypothetical protein FPQ18DRAFT_254982 [Pyronema domesticum]|nr:hypothetical protein FPQ18DRAFT_254982 [Pyronema domesticum]
MQTSQASQNNNTLPSPPRSPPQFLVPKRQFRPIPTKTSREEQRNARRNLFLKKVQHGREEHAWRQRGGEEEIMRMIFVAEHKRREALLEKQASKISTIYEEESEEAFDDRLDEEVPEDLFPEEFLIQQAEKLPFDEFDDYLGQDDKELEELLASMDLGLDAKRK